MNQNSNNLNQSNINTQNNNGIFNNQSLNNSTEKFNQQSFSKKNPLKVNNPYSIQLIISVINYMFCFIFIIIGIVFFISILFDSKTDSGSAFYFFAFPILIAIYVLAFVPDFFSFYLSILNNKKRKKNLLF